MGEKLRVRNGTLVMCRSVSSFVASEILVWIVWEAESAGLKFDKIKMENLVCCLTSISTKIQIIMRSPMLRYMSWGPQGSDMII
jgi:hypothetical protein